MNVLDGDLESIERSRLLFRNFNVFRGILFPFSTFGKKEKSFAILNILDTDFQCFNTKKRAPYKIVFETIK